SVVRVPPERRAGLSDRRQRLPCGAEDAGLPKLEHSLRSRRLEEMDDARDAAGPTGLVARAETGAVVAMEVLVEEQQITPVRILLKHRRPAVNRTPPLLVAQEDPAQTMPDLFGDLIQVHVPA